MSDVEQKAGGRLVWQPAGRPLRVLVSARAAERMRREVSRRSGEGAESGGLLRGSIEHNGIVTVTVDEIEPVAWSFSMAPKDRRELDEALKPDRKQRGAVVGYYRTHSREDLFLNAGDIALIRVCFPDPSNVFLLLKPGPGKSLATRLFFWQAGAMQSDEGDAAFPFGRPAGAAAETPPPVAELRDPASPRPGLSQRFRPPAIARPSRNALWTAAAGAALLALLLLAPWRSFLPGRASDPERARASGPELALAVDKVGSSLVVRWDTKAPSVRDATGGVLRVEDGPYRRTYEFGPEDLRAGSLYYLPVGGDIQLKLEVFRKTGDPLVESVRVLSANLPAAQAGGAETWAHSAPPAPFAAPRNTGSADRSMARPAAAPRARPAPRVEEPAPRPRTVHYGREAETRPGAVHYDDQPRPRTVHFRYREEGAAPAADSGDAATPRPVRQVDPNFPQSVRSSLPGDVELGVRVHIDQTGKVIRAQVVSRKGPATGLLADSALSAAKLWRFEPARRGGRPVPSDTVLNFHFAP